MRQASAGIRCLLFWEGWPMGKKVSYTMQDQLARDGSFYSPQKLLWLLGENIKWHHETLQDLFPESYTWYRPPQKEDNSKYHLIASLEGMYPNCFKRPLSNLFSKLLSCRFSLQPVFHVATSQEVQMFTPLPSLNSCLMSSCISQRLQSKTDCHAF